MIIYLIQNNINKKMYVGQTSTSLEKRWRQHCDRGNLLYSAIIKYGSENFSISILAQTTNRSALNTYEKTAIKKLNTIAPNGYNLRGGGERDFELSEQTKEKLRNVKLGKQGNNYIDYTGKKIGKLSVISVVSGVTGVCYKHWNCVCECGENVVVGSYSLRRADFHACSSCVKKHNSLVYSKDITGSIFGNLKVLKRDGNIKKKAAFLCECACGNTIRTTGQMLRSRQKTRCSRKCSVKIQYKWTKRKLNGQ